jgi:hypothetical protein
MHSAGEQHRGHTLRLHRAAGAPERQQHLQVRVLPVHSASGPAQRHNRLGATSHTDLLASCILVQCSCPCLVLACVALKLMSNADPWLVASVNVSLHICFALQWHRAVQRRADRRAAAARADRGALPGGQLDHAGASEPAAAVCMRLVLRLARATGAGGGRSHCLITKPAPCMMGLLRQGCASASAVRAAARRVCAARQLCCCAVAGQRRQDHILPWPQRKRPALWHTVRREGALQPCSEACALPCAMLRIVLWPAAVGTSLLVG